MRADAKYRAPRGGRVLRKFVKVRLGCSVAYLLTVGAPRFLVYYH